MTRGIFISYRRSDSSGYAGRIFDRLAPSFSRERVFMDVDNIELGLDFVEVLSDRVASCDALLAIIGRDWLEARDAAGKRRLDDPHDFVRIEIEAALKRNTRVIPVLVEGASMPSSDELPEPLKGLARRQGVEISHNRFDSDADLLIRALRRIVEAKQAEAQASPGPASPGPIPGPEPVAPQPRKEPPAAIHVPAPAPVAEPRPAAMARPWQSIAPPAAPRPAGIAAPSAAAEAATPEAPQAAKTAPTAVSPGLEAAKYAGVGLLLGLVFTAMRAMGIWPTTLSVPVILPQDIVYPLAAALPLIVHERRASAKIWALAAILYGLRLTASLLGYAAIAPFVATRNDSMIAAAQLSIGTIALGLDLLACAWLLGLRPAKWTYLLAIPVAAANVGIGFAGISYSLTPALLGGFVAYHSAKRGLSMNPASEDPAQLPASLPPGARAGEAPLLGPFSYQRGLRIASEAVLLLALWFVVVVAITATVHGLGNQPTPALVFGSATILVGGFVYVIIRGRRVSR
jgi:hypothetical protein